jgi:signal transduction histidine kinase
VLILRDVTRDRQEENSLVESERINAIKLLAAGVAHEIGNPLNALTIHLQLLNREIAHLPEGPRSLLGELLDVARNEVSRLDLIITQFLQAIRPAKPNTAPTNMQQLMEETLTLLKLEIQNRQIDVQLNIPEPLPDIPVDRDQMKQAFFNLMKNAFQAMPDGGSLGITLTASGPYLVLAFCDTGVGIAPENLGRIFDAYYTTKDRGSGLGLMIVQRIVHDHGGYIEVESKPGEGATFTIFLPLADRRMSLLPKPEETHSSES